MPQNLATPKVKQVRFDSSLEWGKLSNHLSRLFADKFRWANSAESLGRDIGPRNRCLHEC